jgi:hypothetical protein
MSATAQVALAIVLLVVAYPAGYGIGRLESWLDDRSRRRFEGDGR